MPEPSLLDASSAVPPEDEAIRERVKGLTAQALKEGRVDAEAVREIVRAVIGAAPNPVGPGDAGSRELFTFAVKTLDETLMASASAAHAALQQLAGRGKDFSENDLKEASVRLRKLQQDCTAVSNHIAGAMSGNLRNEVVELAARAQNIGVEASARVASMVDELSKGVDVTSGMARIRDAGVRMTLLASGVLAGVADALREQSSAKNGT